MACTPQPTSLVGKRKYAFDSFFSCISPPMSMSECFHTIAIVTSILIFFCTFEQGENLTQHSAPKARSCADDSEARPDRLAAVRWGRHSRTWATFAQRSVAVYPLRPSVNLAQCTRRPTTMSSGPRWQRLAHDGDWTRNRSVRVEQAIDQSTNDIPPPVSFSLTFIRQPSRHADGPHQLLSPA